MGNRIQGVTLLVGGKAVRAPRLWAAPSLSIATYETMDIRRDRFNQWSLLVVLFACQPQPKENEQCGQISLFTFL